MPYYRSFKTMKKATKCARINEIVLVNEVPYLNTRYGLVRDTGMADDRYQKSGNGYSRQRRDRREL